MKITKGLIKEFYGKEACEGIVEEDDSFETRFTVRAPVHSSFLFKAIAQRFKTTRLDIIEPVLIEAAMEMFQFLTPADRKLVGEMADKEAHSYLVTEAGMTSYHSRGASGVEDEFSYWRDLASVYDNFEDQSKGEQDA